ncbi:outer membrane protein transport protein [Telmatospirillum sp.]|uniref:OmpP1/FadL family transporter n=1 Tax=Telmatospirillum sp. TaxID=2079197 RepID=UPI00284B7E4D|nr:outer membrane protein transport protein [Telmatospirillum sp.]MDR3441173.1 outer membrane protein transport protein [Telmatospirillum sp.]
MRYRHLSSLAGFALALGSALPAHATDGYFEHGYGTQSKGMAGVSLAYPKDALAIATNPASAIVLGDRFDADIDYFQPFRGASISGNAYGRDQSYSGNDSKAFEIPELGYIRQLGEDWAVGIALYGNGGMDTAYSTNPYGRFGATSKAGVDLEQFFISPTLAYRLAEGQSIGISVNIADELFEAQGIGAFGGFSSNSAAISDRGRDSAFGYGVRIGWLGQLAPWLSVGAAWQSKTYADGFDRYKGLFADQGGFDVPATYGAGLAVKALPDLDIALDVRRILYSDVGSVGNDFQRLFSNQALGTTGGPGFGWKDTTSVKIGFNYRIAQVWQVRAGYGYTTQPIPRDETFLNILAPATIQHQITLGGSWTVSNGFDISLYGLYALPQTVRGAGSIPSALGGGEANIKLSEVSTGIGFGWRF